jgi:hypothetical protein
MGPLAKFAVNNLFAWVRLLAGAVVSSVELERCDNDGLRAIGFSMRRTSSPGGPSVLVTPSGFTGVAEQPGCAFFSVSPLPANSPLVIDNENNTYTVTVGASAATVSFTAVRVYYTL